jgi:hypothetical protein
MSITQIAFQANIAQSLVEVNDYKVQNLDVTGDITGKTITDIRVCIEEVEPARDLIERIENLELKKEKITFQTPTTTITNTLNIPGKIIINENEEVQAEEVSVFGKRQESCGHNP